MRTVLKILVIAICLIKSAGQLTTFIHYPELLEKMPPLAIFAQAIVVALHLLAAYLEITRAFLAFVALAIAALTHLVLFPLGIAISSGVVLGDNYWEGFTVSVLSHVLVALLAYASWRVSRREPNVGSVVKRA